MRRCLLFIVIVLFASISVHSVSVRELLPEMDEELLETLISGEVVSDSTQNGDIHYLIPKGALISDTVETVTSYEKGFVVGATVLVPYPEKFRDMTTDEVILSLYNYGQSLSSLKGITYISHRAGDKPKILFEEASVLSSPNQKDKIEDPMFDVIPEYNELYVYLKDTSFGKNIYRVEVRVKDNGLSMELKNSNELKFMGIGIVAEGKITMLVEVTLTDEGILFSCVGSVKDKNPTMNILVYKVDLELSFMNRIIALKDWYVDKLK